MSQGKGREARPGMKAVGRSTPVVRLSWAEDALCNETGPFLFDEVKTPRGTVPGLPARKSIAYRKSEKRRNAARRLCQVCPVFDDCATHVMTVGEPYGVWAGMSTKQRNRVINAYRDIDDRVEALRASLFKIPLFLGSLTQEQFRGTRVRRAVAEALVLEAEELAIDAALQVDGVADAEAREDADEPSVPSSTETNMAQAS